MKKLYISPEATLIRVSTLSAITINPASTEVKDNSTSGGGTSDGPYGGEDDGSDDWGNAKGWHSVGKSPWNSWDE